MIAYGLESRAVWLDWTDEDTKVYKYVLSILPLMASLGSEKQEALREKS